MNFLTIQTEDLVFPSFYRFGIYSGRTSRDLDLESLDFTGHINNYLRGRREIFRISNNNRFSTKNFEDYNSLEKYIFDLYDIAVSSPVNFPSSMYLGIESLEVIENQGLSKSRKLISDIEAELFKEVINTRYVSFEELRKQKQQRKIQRDIDSDDRGYGGFRRIGLGLGRGQF